jgi:hypothetical protein
MSAASRGAYLALRGEVSVDRPLYRQCGVRNGPTLDPIALQAGLVGGRTTPAAAVAIGAMMQALPVREARATAHACHVLPFGQSTFQRVAETLGETWESHRADAEDHLVEQLDVPAAAASVSVAADRVSMRVLEPGDHGVHVAYRMIHVGCLTLHDSAGRPLHTLRYGRLPDTGHADLVASLRSDLDAILAQRPDLRIVTLADGAPEMQRLVDQVIAAKEVAAQLVDYWHLVEKVAAAVREVDHGVPDLLDDLVGDLLERDAGIDRIERWLTWYARIRSRTQPIHEALTYIENHRERMRYASARRAGLPIGSGQVEASCKSLVAVRMKRGGARWGPRGAQAILNLRSLALSDRWEPAMAYVLDTFVRPLREVA